MTSGEEHGYELRQSRKPPDPLGKHRGAEDFLSLDSGRRLLCAFCADPITTDEQRVAIEGRHVHRRTNPAGFDFEFGCFSQAPGANLTGEQTAEHTWFAGYQWRFSICGCCSAHLGWHFERSGSSFHGLILDRLEVE